MSFPVVENELLLRGLKTILNGFKNRPTKIDISLGSTILLRTDEEGFMAEMSR